MILAVLENRLELLTAKSLDLFAPVLQDKAGVGARSALLTSVSAWRPAGWLGYNWTQHTEKRQKSRLMSSSIWHHLRRSLRPLVSYSAVENPDLR